LGGLFPAAVGFGRIRRAGPFLRWGVAFSSPKVFFLHPVFSPFFCVILFFRPGAFLLTREHHPFMTATTGAPLPATSPMTYDARLTSLANISLLFREMFAKTNIAFSL